MIGVYRYSPDILPLLAITFLVAALGVYSWRQRAVSGAAYFAVACVFWTLSLLALTARTVATDPALQLAMHTFQAMLQLPIVTAIACFTLDYVQPGRWLSWRNLFLLAMPPLLVALLMLTNDAARQVEVLRLVAAGLTYKEVGQQLALSERTVRYHMAEIMARLHLEHRSQVIAYAGKSGLLPSA